MNLLSTQTMNVLEKGINGAALRQKTIANNIANVDTPYYKSQNVNFEHTLAEAMGEQKVKASRTDHRHIEFGGNPKDAFITRNYSTNFNNNLNNVDIDKEMAAMAKNQIYYNALIDRINSQFKSLQSVIKGGN